MSSNKMRFGEYLLSKNLIDSSDLRIALNKQRDSNSKYSQLGNVIYALSILDEEVLCSALSEFEGIEYMPITNINLENYGERLLNIIERKDIIDHKMLPIYINDLDKEIGIVTIEQSPQKLEYLNSFLKTRGKKPSDYKFRLKNALEHPYHLKLKEYLEMLKKYDSTLSALEIEDNTLISIDLTDKISQAFRKAISLGSDQVRFDILDDSIKISVDINDKKVDLPNVHIDYRYHDHIWRLLCGMAGVPTVSLKSGGYLDIAIDDILKDGKYSSRINFLDTIRGVCATCRIIPKDNTIFDIKGDLGVTSRNEISLQKAATYNAGIGLITGPQSSGKNTTAYAIIKEIQKYDKHTLTMEDPVEVRLEGVNQMNTNLNTFDWDEGDKAILRTATKVLFIGEIREPEALDMAIRLANSSVFLLTTLHIDTCYEVFSRINGLTKNVEGAISAIKYVTNQRKLPNICQHCGKEVPISTLPTYIRKTLQNKYHYTGRVFIKNPTGCSYCTMGEVVKSVSIVMEVLEFTDELRELIYDQPNILHKERITREYMLRNHNTLGHNALIQMNEGKISLNSIMDWRLLEF